MADETRFVWRGQEYIVPLEVGLIGRVVLFDGTVLEVVRGEHGVPLDPVGFREVCHDFGGESNELIAVAMNATIATPVFVGRRVTAEERADEERVVRLAGRLVQLVREGRFDLDQSKIVGDDLHVATGSGDFLVIATGSGWIGRVQAGQEEVHWGYDRSTLTMLGAVLSCWVKELE